jgi:transposase
MLFVGDDWAEDHHDVEIVDETGRTLARRRFPEGLAGITRLHALIGEQLPEPAGPADPVLEVVVGIETERGPWAAALVAAGYRVFAINPLSSARYRERHSTSGAKSDAGDAHILAEIVRLDRAHHRQVAGDTALAEAVKLAARTHQSLVWDRTRQILRLRSALRESFPAALKAYNELDAPDTLQLLRLAPDPDKAARLSKRQIVAALARANRRNTEAVADRIHAILRASELRQAGPVQSAFAAIVAAQVEIITTLNEQIDVLGEVVADHLAGTRTLS